MSISETTYEGEHSSYMTTYQKAGVDSEQQNIATQRITDHIKRTWPQGEGTGSVVLDVGFFANVINIGGIGVSISTDGVGTKALIAQMMEKYDTIGIDCVAMNVNDLLCVGSTPISMVDYIALQDPIPKLLEEISKGLTEGAKIAGISISGGETAQLRDIIKGHKEGFGFDLAGMAIGTVPLDKIIIGRDIEEGDAIIGLESNGIHCNGLSLARNVFFEKNRFTTETEISPLKRKLGEELLRPTHIYVREVLEIINSGVHVKALANITSDGFLNLTRLDSDVSYDIEELPPAPPIFSLIQKHGNVSDEEMFFVYNMGIGFCIIVPPEEAERVISIVHSHEKRAYKIGRTISDKEHKVYVRPKGLVGKDKRFQKINPW